MGRKQRISFSQHIQRGIPALLLALTPLHAIDYPQLSKEPVENVPENSSRPKKNLREVKTVCRGVCTEDRPYEEPATSSLGKATPIEAPLRFYTTEENGLGTLSKRENPIAEATPRSFLKDIPLDPSARVEEAPKEEPPPAPAVVEEPKKEVPQVLKKEFELPSFDQIAPYNKAPVIEMAAPAEAPPFQPAEKPEESVETKPPLEETPAPQQAAPEPVKEAPPPTPAPLKAPAAPGQGFLINFSNVQITEYIRFVSRISGKNFIFNEDELQFTVTIVSEEPTSIDEIMAALMQELRIHGLSMIEQGNNILLHTNAQVNSPSNIVAAGTKKLPPDAQLVTRVFLLNNFDPARAADIIKPLLSNQAIIEPLSETSHLILTDLVVNVNRVAELLKSLDQPAQGLVMGQYKAQNVFADALALMAERIIIPLAESRPVQFIPFRETNIVYVISTDYFVEKTIEILEEIDMGAREQASALSSLVGGDLLGTQRNLNAQQAAEQAAQLGQYGPGGAPLWSQGLPLGHVLNTEFSIYHLAYRKGDEIQAALQQIGNSMFSIAGIDEGTNSELLSAILTVQWIESSNSLIFSGTRAAVLKLRQIIKEMDTPNQQVLIEMLLLETTIDDSLTFAVNFGSRFGDNSWAGSQAFLSEGSPIPVAMDQIPNGGILSPNNLARTRGYNLGVIGQTISKCGQEFGSISALVSSLHNDIETKVILNEKILVEDNHSAEVFAGLNIPYKTQSIANEFGTILTNNYEYRDVGARLIVTPTINVNGIITMEIEQELSTLVTQSALLNTLFAAVSDAGYSTRKSNSRTTIFVPNRYFVILSGVIQDEQERDHLNVPCLGGVPVLGAAFSEKRNQGSKRVLMIFMRPTLMTTEEEIRNETKRQQDIHEQWTEEKNLWQYEVDEALDYFNIRKLGCPLNNNCQ